MKKRPISLIILSLLLSSCTISPATSESGSYDDSPPVSETTSEDDSTGDSGGSTTGSESTETRTLSIYGINDFHGQIDEDSSSYQAGISKLGGFLKSKGDEENTILINSGDMWQGSFDSNYNRGALLTDVMNYIEFDCFTLGNHEFDWGTEYITSNRARKGYNGDGEGYQTPFLAANVYNYDMSTGTVGDYADLGDQYNIVYTENGLKVGIIGVIGYDQITSINSKFVDDLTFLDPVEVAKDLGEELKVNQDCDVVILSAHCAASSLIGDNSADPDGLTDYITGTSERYVDAVFCAHTHYAEKTEVNGVPFVQAGCYGRYYDYVELEVSPEGDVSCTTYQYTYTSTIDDSYKDATIESIVSSYTDETQTISSEVLATFSGGTFSSTEEIPNLVSYAMAEEAIAQGYDIDYALTNKTRANISSGSVTYADLFKSVPFDNEIYIMEVKGDDLLKELNYNYFTRLDANAIDENQTYTIAVIDYLATHRNSNRQYDYFTEFTIIGTLEKEGYDIYNYREITANYLRSLSSTVTASEFSSSQTRHSRDLLSSNVTL